MRNLVLFGMMGAGKTTVAAVIGELLQREVVDTDLDVEHDEDRTIQQIFAEDGEPTFRELERQAVLDAAERDDRVIAVGGGAVLDPVNVGALRATGMLIWLEASADVLTDRLSDEQAAGTRPLLDDGGFEDLLTERAPTYGEVADHTVDASGDPQTVADDVLSWAARIPDVLSTEEHDRIRGEVPRA